MSYWHYVPGFDISLSIYDDIAKNATESDIVALTGVGFGRNLHYLLEALKKNNKRPKVYAFDTFGEEHLGSEYWEGHPSHTPWGESFTEWATRIGGASRLIDQFVFHLSNSPAREYLTDWAQFPHWTVAEEFKDNSLSWVIAGGGHSEKVINREVEKWWPKLKSGGTIMCNSRDGSNYRPVMIKT